MNSVDISEEVNMWTMITTPFVESFLENGIEQRWRQAGNDEVESYRNNGQDASSESKLSFQTSNMMLKARRKSCSH